MKAGNRYPVTVADIRERLADQWRRHRYAVTLKHAYVILNQLSQDDGLLETCARLKVNVTQVIWDMTVASARRQLLKGLTASRRQAKDTVKKARRRAPSVNVTGDERIMARRFRAKYQIKMLTQTLSRRQDILAKYSNPPGKERDDPRLNARGRREDTARNWLFEKVNAHLSRVPGTARDDIRCRLLKHSEFLYAGRVKDLNEAYWNAPATIKKKLSRLDSKCPARSKNQS